MNFSFASRMNHVHKSFVREILKATVNPEVISFAGGLPNPKFFPAEEIAAASSRVLHEDGETALQYSTTEGYQPLRQWIADRYAQKSGLSVLPEDILITNGSQQALDLIGKVFLNPNDTVLLEKPAYLGAIQAFSVFEPQFVPVSLREDGIDTEELAQTLNRCEAKLFYTVPNFQNPTGLTYTAENRRQLANTLQSHNTILIEDNPYGELRFLGTDQPNMKTFLGDPCILLGSFSKIFAPAMRLGWICACPAIMEKLVTVKQAADLHTNYFSQRVLFQYLQDNDLDTHIRRITQAYKQQRDCMVENLCRYFPADVQITEPEGGMFLWMTLPEGISAMDLFERASARNVAFVPGNPFYVHADSVNTLRLNYTNSDNKEIETGIQRLAEALSELRRTV